MHYTESDELPPSHAVVESTDDVFDTLISLPYNTATFAIPCRHAPLLSPCRSAASHIVSIRPNSSSTFAPPCLPSCGKGNEEGEPFRFQQYRSDFLDTDTKTPPPHIGSGDADRQYLIESPNGGRERRGGRDGGRDGKAPRPRRTRPDGRDGNGKLRGGTTNGKRQWWQGRIDTVSSDLLRSASFRSARLIG